MPLHSQVSELIRRVAAEVVVPRFRKLASHEIAEKSPGEIVTCVDREAELRLRDGLAALLPGARVVGEEAAAEDPSLLGDIGEGLVWLVDPLDGTANFAAGREPFGMMVAIVEDGVPLQGWLYDPISGRLCHAARGKGATLNDTPARARATLLTPPVAALGTHFLAPERQVRVHAHAGRRLAIAPVPRCAAESYPRLVTGRDDIALFHRILPWDHAAGVLFVEEAGGRVTHWDGQPYRVGGSGIGVLAAANDGLWQEAADVLLTSEAGLVETEACIS